MLPPIKQEVLRLYYGIGGEALGSVAIGRKVGLSYQWIGQIVTESLAMLREASGKIQRRKADGGMN